jgi:ATP-dependent helicase HrpB
MKKATSSHFFPARRRFAGWPACWPESGLADRWDVAPLYGNLTRAQQDAAIAPPPAGRRKIVLASAIAETSLTIEQIRVVVDSGLQRAPRFDPRTGMTRLVTLPVSRASADQRRGGPAAWARGSATACGAKARIPPCRPQPAGDPRHRSGRIWPWNWPSGAPSPDGLGWLDPPPAGAFEQARALLADLGALDALGKITDHGRRMAELPLHPAWPICSGCPAGGHGACGVRGGGHFERTRSAAFYRGHADADLRLRMDVAARLQAQRPMTIPDCSVDDGACGEF